MKIKGNSEMREAGYIGLANRRLQPLGHVSGVKSPIFQRALGQPEIGAEADSAPIFASGDHVFYHSDHTCAGDRFAIRSGERAPENPALDRALAEALGKFTDRALARAFGAETTAAMVVADPPKLDVAAMLAVVEGAKAMIFDVTGLDRTAENHRAFNDALLFGLPMPPVAYVSMTILEDQNCLKETEERLFPVSKNRSKRIHKKLVKRFGGEYRKVPVMYWLGPHTLVAHPTIAATLKVMPW